VKSVEFPITFLSSKEFDARIPSLCELIKDRIAEENCDTVLLWVQSPGKSNFWMSLLCWPFLRDVVDEVWSFESTRDPYLGLGSHTAHISVDDAIFTG
jgi:hypothetical protein